MCLDCDHGVIRVLDWDYAGDHAVCTRKVWFVRFERCPDCTGQGRCPSCLTSLLPVADHLDDESPYSPLVARLPGDSGEFCPACGFHFREPEGVEYDE